MEDEKGRNRKEAQIAERLHRRAESLDIRLGPELEEYKTIFDNLDVFTDGRIKLSAMKPLIPCLTILRNVRTLHVAYFIIHF